MITLIGVAALMASIVMMNTQSTSLGIVQHAEASSALNEGYNTGRNDYLNGNMKDTYCDPDTSDSNPDAYCFQYKIGYEAGWAAARGLYGDQ